MRQDITTLVYSCAHCRLANVTMHNYAGPLLRLKEDASLDVVFFELWPPGDSIIEKDGAKKLLT